MIPTDPTSGSTATTDNALSRAAAANLLKAVAGTATDVFGFGTNVKVALLKGDPVLNTSTGVYDISSVEHEATLSPGYARMTIPRVAGFDAPFLYPPATAGVAKVANNVQVETPLATGDWPAINAVALLDNAGAVIKWRPLDAPVYVKSGKVARIPIAALFFYTPSA